MKKTFIVLLGVVLFCCLTGCTRTFSNGDTEEVGFWGKTRDVLLGVSPRKDKKPIVKKKTVPLTGDAEKDKSIVEKNDAIEKFNAKADLDNADIEKHNEGAVSDRENPDPGWLGYIGTGASIALIILAKMKGIDVTRLQGMVDAGETLIAKGAEKLAEAEQKELGWQGSWQAVKDVGRSNPDLLKKMKEARDIGEGVVKENTDIFKKTDGYAIFKQKYKSITNTKPEQNT